MKYAIYNLEFRPYCNVLQIGPYRFERVPDYAERHKQLQHLVNSTGSEFTTKVCTGGHVHTAYADVPAEQPKSVIDWQSESATELNDVLLILRLFTLRDVFALTGSDEEHSMNFAITNSPNNFRWGGVISCSLPYVREEGSSKYKGVDATLSTHLPSIYGLLHEPDWQRKFCHGSFLVLLDQVLKQNALESAFVQSWTIWEHLFACLNQTWMSEESIRKISSKEKIAFLLVHFAFKDELSKSEKGRLSELVKIRNRMIHFGRFPQESGVRERAEMFVRMTEFLAAKALNLLPSNLFNTLEKFETFLVSAASSKQN